MLRKNTVAKIELADSGGFLFVDLGDIDLSPDLQIDGMWEPMETNFIKSYLKSGMTFVDIGANIGYYTVLAAHKVGDRGRVIAFEPDPRNFNILLKNIKLHSLKNVTAIARALTDHSGTQDLWKSKIFYGDHRVYQPKDGDHIRIGAQWSKVSVRSTTLDECAEEKSFLPDLIKIDIQGAESLAFRGMRTVLQKNPYVTLIMEFWPHGLRQAGATPEAFLNDIRAQNFYLYMLTSQGPVKVSDQDILGFTRDNAHINVIASRTQSFAV